MPKEIITNNMKAIKSHNFWFGNLGQYLLVVTVKCTKDPTRTWQYADFTPGYSDEDILNVMHRGFKPGQFKEWTQEVIK